MCEYCDLFNEHIEIMAKVMKLFEEEGLSLDTALQLMLYNVGYTTTVIRPLDNDTTEVINNCFNAGLSRGENYRAKYKQDRSKLS